jgi:hypothetical protein
MATNTKRVWKNGGIKSKTMFGVREPNITDIFEKLAS